MAETSEPQLAHERRPGPTRVLVVDDHPIVRLGIRQLIGGERDLVICGEAESPEGAVALTRQTKPRLAIVDLSLAQGNGLELIRELRETSPELSVLVLSMHDETLYAERALRAGARGYIMKRQAITGLVDAIRTILAGRIYVSEAIAQTILERVGNQDAVPRDPLAQLSDRELEVYDLIGQGLTTVAIAEQLRVSIKTIETYRSNIKTKLNLKDAANLIRHATTQVEGLAST